MKTVKPNVLEYMMRGLKKYAISGTVDIPVWEYVTGMYLGDGEYSRDPNYAFRGQMGSLI